MSIISHNIRFNILGRNFEATIFNTREIIWENMNINFIFVLSESSLTNAPHTWIASTTSENKEIKFVQLSGPCHISLNQKQLSSHGPEYHSNGYSSPIGNIKQIN